MGVLPILGTGRTRARELLPLAPLTALPLVQVLVRTSVRPIATMEAFVELTVMVMAFAALRSVHEDRDARRRTAMALVVSALLQAVWGVGQHSLAPATIYGRPTPWITTPFGAFVNHNHFAILAVMASLVGVGLAIDAWSRARGPSASSIGWMGAGLALALAVLGSRSRSGFVSMSAAAVFLGMLGAGRKERRAAAGVAAIGALLLALALAPGESRARLTSLVGEADGSIQYRLDLAAATMGLIADRPLVGSGVGAFVDAITPFKSKHGDVQATHAENDALELLAEAGALGLAAVAIAVTFLVRESARNRRSRRWLSIGAIAACLGFAAHSLMDFPLRVPALALALVCCLSLAAAPAPHIEEPRQPRWVRPFLVVTLAVLATVAGWRAASEMYLSHAVSVPEPHRRLSALDRSLVLNPFASRAWAERARTRVNLAAGVLRSKHLEQAAADYRRALSLRPAWAAGWYELAWVEWAGGDPEASRRALARAGRLDPSTWALGFARAELVNELDGPEAAIRALVALRDRAPGLRDDWIQSRARTLTSDPALIRLLDQRGQTDIK